MPVCLRVSEFVKGQTFGGRQKRFINISVGDNEWFSEVGLEKRVYNRISARLDCMLNNYSLLHAQLPVKLSARFNLKANSSENMINYLIDISSVSEFKEDKDLQ